MNLSIKNLSVEVAGKKILNNISLELNPGKLIALMGPNGSGKSSLAQALMGHPSYSIVNSNGFSSSAKIGTEEILGISPDKRARLGLFLGFQNPVSVPGVTVANLLRIAVKEKEEHLHNPALNVLQFNE